MVWFFERAQEVTRLETTFDNDAQEYVLVMEVVGANALTERFATLAGFQTRLVELEQQLRAQSWVQRGDVEIMDDGWRGPSTRRH
jgi:hypothetical protein